jgi:hypothetical protein
MACQEQHPAGWRLSVDLRLRMEQFLPNWKHVMWQGAEINRFGAMF